MKKFFLNIIILFAVFSVQAQIPIGMPPVYNYTEDDYFASTQNWSTVQDKNGLMYFANSTGGVLMFDGISWQQISVNGKTVRSLAVDSENRIWVGAKNDLGYIDTDSIGNPIFISLHDKIPLKYRDYINVWDIFILNHQEICFFTNDYFFKLKNDNFTVITNKEYIGRSFLIANEIYFTSIGEGLRKLSTNKTIFIKGSEIFSDKVVKAIIKKSETELLLFTRFDGVYLYDGNTFIKTETPVDEAIKNKLYKIFPIDDELFAFSLVNDGLLITDKNFKPIKTIKLENGILGNNIRELFLDKNNNIWLNTNSGISSFSLYPTFTYWGKTYGLTSRTLSSAIYNNTIYIGNYNGMSYFQLKPDKNNIIKETLFNKVENIKGEIVYSMGIINNSLFGIENSGFFIVKDNKAEYIKEDKNFRIFEQFDENHIIIGAKTGLFLIEYRNNKWQFKSKIKGFNEYSIYLEIDKYNNIWVADRNKAVYKISLNNNFDSISQISTFDSTSTNGLPDYKDNIVYQINNEIVVTTSKGIYKYDYEQNLFYPYLEINKLINNKFVNVIFEDSNNNIWLKIKEFERKNRQKVIVWNLVKLELQKDGSFVLKKNLFKHFQSNIYSFNQINDSLFLIGNKKGFSIYNVLIKQLDSFPVIIRSFEYIVNTDSSKVLFNGIYISETENTLSNNKIISLPYKHNSIRFTFSALDFKNGESLLFSCKLEGFNKNWTSWSGVNSKEFINLKEGEYIFKVKAKNIYDNETQIATYKFVIKPPWYRTIWAYITYIVLIVLLIYIIIRTYTFRLRKKQEYLENVVRERTAEIRQQNEEIQTQNDMLFDKNDEIKKQKNEIESQRDIAYKQKQEITDSIIYAKRIQEAILPSKGFLDKILPEYFIFFKPRDIVSGDFYWVEKTKNKILVVAADSTGHGVPGAFMSMLGASLLNEIVLYENIQDTGQLLNELRNKIKQSLHQSGKEGEAQDGMDLALYSIDTDTLELQFSGAFNSLYIIRNQNSNVADEKEIIQLKADRQPISIYVIEKPFVTHNFQLQKNDTIYSFSDGYTDQFGGENFDKFKIKRFKKLLLQIQNLTMQKQKEFLFETFTEWTSYENKKEHISDQIQLDDVLVIGVRV